MYEIFTYGRFEVPPENEDAFVAAWSEFAAWVSTQPGAQTLRLVARHAERGALRQLRPVGRAPMRFRRGRAPTSSSSGWGRS